MEELIASNNYASLVRDLPRLALWLTSEPQNLLFFVEKAYSLTIFDCIIKHMGTKELTQRLHAISHYLTPMQVHYLQHNLGLQL